MTVEQIVSNQPEHAKATQEQPDPFLSVVLLPGTASALELMDVFVALDAQTTTDFELILVAPSALATDRMRFVELLEPFSSGLSARTQTIAVANAQQSAAGCGLATAKGRYIAFLDGRSIVFAHYVETFLRLATERPGAVLRARALIQPMHPMLWPGDRGGFEPLAGARPAAARTESPLSQLTSAESPRGSYAIPRSHFAENSELSAESAFLSEAVMRCGLHDADNAVVLLVRQFDHDQPSELDERTKEDPKQTEQVLPAESPAQARLTDILAECATARVELEAARAELDALRTSTSWRITAPLRWLTGALRRFRSV